MIERLVANSFVSSIVLLGVATVAAMGQTTLDDLPWPLRLGARVHACEQGHPVVSQVVLVPDGATYLREIGRWSAEGQWPVLFEGDPNAAGFIRRFAPEVVRRAPSVGRLESTTIESGIEDAVRSAWGGVDGSTSLVETFKKIGWIPPGFVVADPGDPAWTAAAALAAGRGLPVIFDRTDLGRVDTQMSAVALEEFAEALRRAAASTGLTWRTMGDDLDTVTVCKTMPIRCRMEVPEPAQVWHAALDPGTGPYATTDALGRNARGDRWACVGTIWGDEARAASMAMSAMFLPRTDVWLVSGYETSGPWATYDVAEIAVKLPSRGYEVSRTTGTEASRANWLRLLTGGTSADLLYVNSHGFRDVFHLHRNDRLYAQDVPITDHPMVVSMVHSFSLQRPDDPNSVGGRLLRRGAYGYLGSVDEPFLMAFVPPALQLERVSAGVPVLVAGRYWPGEGIMSGVWKIASIGDPLMLAPSNRISTRRRIAPTDATSPPDAIDVRERAGLSLEALRTDPSAAPEAIHDLELLGKDELALGAWRLVRGREHVAVREAARAILGPLFRAGDWTSFLDAYRRLSLEERDLEAKDMLWHLATPRLSSIADREILLVLAGEVRGPRDTVDLGRIGPHLDRVLGKGAGRRAIERRLQTVTVPVRREALRKMLDAD